MKDEKKAALLEAASGNTRPNFSISLATDINAPIVHLHMGKPVTDSLAIAHEFGRSHKNVLQSLDGLIENGTIGRLE